MAELADAHDSGSCGATHAGSSPVIRTKMQTNRECEKKSVKNNPSMIEYK